MEDLKSKPRKKSVEKVILELSEKQLSRVQSVSLHKLLQTEFKKHRADLNLKARIETETNRQKELLKRLQEIREKENKKTRRDRAHELITIGALTELIGFPKDRGIVAGAFAYVLEKIEQDPNFENIIKTNGNRIIKEREDEKNQKRKKTVSD